MMTSVGTRTLNQLKNRFLASRKKQDLKKKIANNLTKALCKITYLFKFISQYHASETKIWNSVFQVDTQSNPSLMMTPIQKMF